MYKKLGLILIIGFCNMQSAFSYAPEVKTSPRPTLRPENLDTTAEVKDGVFKDGVMKLTLKFFDKGVFYQSNQSEHIIPIVYYLKNEYPEVDFSQLRMTSINVNTRTLGGPALTRFYSKYSELLSEYYIPEIQSYGEVFGEYTNASLDGDFINNLLYIGISGIQNINNVTAYFEVGSPNFSLDLNDMPTQGQFVGDLEGYEQPVLNEYIYQDMLAEIEKMSSSNYFNDYNNDYNPNDDFPSPYVNPPIPYEDYNRPSLPYIGDDNRDYSPEQKVSYPIGKVRLFGSYNVILRLNSGQGQLTGYTITKRNGSSEFKPLYLYLDRYNQASVKVRSRDSRGTITFIFSSLSSNATTTFIREDR